MSLLTLQDVSLKMASQIYPILQQINYQILPGDFIILLGSNGSGKSSLLKLIHRHYQPSTGQILLHDKSIASYTPKHFAKHIAFLTQNSGESLYTTLSIFENYLLMQKQRKLRNETALKLYLRPFNSNLAKKLHSPIQVLSGGERQALGLAMCLLNKPQLLLLDEHTSALDPKTATQMMQITANIIAENHITCILTTHDLDIAMQYGNRILILKEGKIHMTYERENNQCITKDLLLKNYH